MNSYSEEFKAKVREYYATTPDEEFNLRPFAESIGEPYERVKDAAKSLGLVNKNRPRSKAHREKIGVSNMLASIERAAAGGISRKGNTPTASRNTRSAYKQMFKDGPVCEEWADYQVFLNDMGPSPYCHPPGVLDRVDKRHPFQKGNVRWMWGHGNIRRQRLISARGKKMARTDWASETGISDTAIKERIRRDWSRQEAATCPVEHGRTTLESVKRSLRTWKQYQTVVDRFGERVTDLKTIVYPVYSR